MNAITRSLLLAGAAGLAATSLACTEERPTKTTAAPVAASQPAHVAPTTAASQPAGAAAEPAVAEPPFTGEVKLDANVAKDAVKASDVLFIMARTQSGQLAAVKRVSPVELPLKYEVSAKDLMVRGTPFSGPFVVSARLDRDGDPMTKGADDLYANAKEMVNAGQANVELVLRAGPPELPPSGLPNLPTGQAPANATGQPAAK